MVQEGEALTHDVESQRAPMPGEHLERSVPRGVPRCTRLRIPVELHFPNGVTRKVLALIDTGAEINVIHPRLVPEGMFRQSERPLRLGTANANCMVGGRREATFMVGMQATDIDSRRGLELRMPMAAYDGEMVCELIVSYGWLAQQNALVNPRRHGLLFCEKGHML